MTPLLPALKQATRGHHDRLESRLDIMGPAYGLAEYTRLLQAFLGFHRPLEARLARVPGLPARVPDLQQRAKAGWLAEDLTVLGLDADSIARLPECKALPEFPDTATALGALYVVEGSTLGALAIGPHFRRRLGVESGAGGRYFAAYGRETMARWKDFGARCVDVDADSAAGKAAIETACATFESLETWLEELGVFGTGPGPAGPQTGGAEGP
jgi:heme oxygenase